MSTNICFRESDEMFPYCVAMFFPKDEPIWKKIKHPSRMTSKWKSVFKRPLSHDSTNPRPVENHEESSAIMQEMTELPADFILGPDPKASKSRPVFNSSQSAIEQPTVELRNNDSRKSHGTSLGAIEDLLQCPICLARLRTPRMMPCQHTFCLECLEEQLNYSGNDGRTIKCPLCKLTVVESVPRDLPTNLYIENLLRVMGNVGGESLEHLVFSSPVVTFAPCVDQPSSLVQGPSSLMSMPEPVVQEIRCVKCETACTRENRCKHCKQIFCSVCWVAHMDDLKEQLGNITEQLSNTTDRFQHRIQDYKTRVDQLMEYIDRDIELRIGELRQEREERIQQVQESARKGEHLAEELKGKIIRTKEEVDAYQCFKFDTLADNQEKVKTFLALHRRASELMTAVAYWQPEISDSLDDQDEKQRINFATSEETAQFYYRSKTFTPRIVAGRGIVQRPSGITMDPWKKHFLVACPGTRQVLVLDKKYRVHRRIQHEGMMSPQGVAFLEDFEELFVTDKWKHCIHVFNSKGTLLRRLCTKGQGDGQLRSPEGIAAHPSRNLLYVADTGNDRIHILTPDGATFATIGPTGNAETVLTKAGVEITNNATHFNQPTAVAVSETVIVVADCGNHKIKIFDHAANLLRTIGTPGTHRGLLRSPETVTLDPKGNVIVGDSGNGRVQIFTATGELLRVLGSKGTKEGQFGWVSGIFVKDNCEIVVADSKNYTIQVF
ncbi:tripartite motif-containing protein 2 isoform X1 [Neodiprion lecontei]|uniref:Tripartite motif-containing protein 2 isoform X1 n=2 Tax=Neodiprion lecontei TaxID=441921 RepID=A0A6J0B356_NEOLC|nr:tripartite motif-containing protein 2 isoform X1 [Neodiprion lecontei]